MDDVHLLKATSFRPRNWRVTAGGYLVAVVDKNLQKMSLRREEARCSSFRSVTMILASAVGVLLTVDL